MKGHVSRLPKYLTQAEIQTLFETITDVRDRALFGLSYAYGLRLGEIVLLDRNDVDRERRRIRIRRLKGGVSGERPIFRNVARLLDEYLKTRSGDDNPALFLGREGRLGRRRVQQLFNRYATKALIPPDRRHVHVLRHSVAVHVLNAGEEIDLARDHLRHKSIESTMIYAQVSHHRRNRALRRLERSRPDFPLPS